MIVETDKATIEIPIDENCIIKKIHVNIGDLISPGQNILDYEPTDSNLSKKTKTAHDNSDKEKKDEVVSILGMKNEAGTTDSPPAEQPRTAETEVEIVFVEWKVSQAHRIVDFACEIEPNLERTTGPVGNRYRVSRLVFYQLHFFEHAIG